MAIYWCRILSAGNRTLIGHLIEASADSEAIANAHAIFNARVDRSFELWQGDRLVHREGRDAP